MALLKHSLSLLAGCKAVTPACPLVTAEAPWSAISRLFWGMRRIRGISTGVLAVQKVSSVPGWDPLLFSPGLDGQGSLNFFYRQLQKEINAILFKADKGPLRVRRDLLDKLYGIKNGQDIAHQAQHNIDWAKGDHGHQVLEIEIFDEILRPRPPKTYLDDFSEFTLLQDNDPKYTCTAKYIEEQRIGWVTMTPEFPSLNSIEMMWARLKWS